MIGPVVAKIAVEQARKAGSAIGDIYFWGAVGSIAGTFLAGFILMYVARISGIVTMVAAALCLLSAAMMGRGPGLIVGLLASAVSRARLDRAPDPRRRAFRTSRWARAP